MLNGGPDLSQGPKLRGPGARRPSLLPQGCQPFLPSNQETQAWNPMKELDLGSNLKPASDSRSPGDLGKCPQCPRPDWRQGGIVGWSLLGEGGWRQCLLWPLPARDLTNPSFPIKLVFGLPARLPDVLPAECSPLSLAPSGTGFLQGGSALFLGTSPCYPCSPKESCGFPGAGGARGDCPCLLSASRGGM